MDMMSQVTTARQGAMEAMKVGRIPRARASLSIALFLIPYSLSLIPHSSTTYIFYLVPPVLVSLIPSARVLPRLPICSLLFSALCLHILLPCLHLESGHPALAPHSSARAPTTCPFPGPEPKS